MFQLFGNSFVNYLSSYQNSTTYFTIKGNS